MTTPEIENRLRRFLLLLTGFALLATLVELVLEEHTQETLQWIPFFLCGIGLIAVAAVLLRPSRATLRALRVAMILLGLGGILGAVLHLRANFLFEQEIRPNAALGDLILTTLQGASPLLAPGIMLLVALVALAATYYHPALTARSNAGEPG